jgi:hypothetical protein
VSLLTQPLFSTGQVYLRRTAWYAKPQATVSDTIAPVRRWLWSHAYFSTLPNEADMIKIRHPLLNRFIDSLCHAA